MNNDEKTVELLHNKANELFKICDEEKKGFIVKKDMQKIKNIVSLTPDVLEDVFDSLDIEKNGYLTLDEFIYRFKDFFGIINENKDPNYVGDEINDEIFKETIESLGASNLIEDLLDIKPLWSYLRKHDINMQKMFENVVRYFCKELRRFRVEFSSLEAALQKYVSPFISLNLNLKFNNFKVKRLLMKKK